MHLFAKVCIIWSWCIDPLSHESLEKFVQCILIIFIPHSTSDPSPIPAHLILSLKIMKYNLCYP